jgi:hypothetical protein
MPLYDQETSTQTNQETPDGDKRKVDAVGHTYGKHNPMYLRVGHGGQLYVGLVGKGSGQRRDIQNDFTRFFYSYRRHDWVPVWYQTHAK